MRILLSLLLVSSLVAEEWKYLYSRPFKSRYAVAAYYLQDCPTIVEIGGYKTPISDFVKEDKHIIVLDPKIEPKLEKNIQHLPIRFQDWNSSAIQNESYGLVLIGLHLLEMSKEDWENLYQLINNSSITLIETADTWKPSTTQYKQILKHTKKKQALQIHMDFANNNFGDLKNSYPPTTKRTIYILE